MGVFGCTQWQYLAKFHPKITIFLGEFSTKPAIVCPKIVSWRSNQEWRSICADTVVEISQSMKIDFKLDLNYAVEILCLMPWGMCEPNLRRSEPSSGTLT